MYRIYCISAVPCPSTELTLVLIHLTACNITSGVGVCHAGDGMHLALGGRQLQWAQATGSSGPGEAIQLAVCCVAVGLLLGYQATSK